MQSLLVNLLKTLIVEIPVYGIFLRKEIWLGLVYIILLNAFTLPLATLAYHRLDWNWYVVESLVVIIEGLCTWIFWKGKFFPSMGIALLANGISAYLYQFISLGF